ncbi:MAG: BrnA antitoxin family protein [Acidobacteria bacterium]|nr:BrnA antitoxin family protein [Acidobacteriota bacterium]
MTDDDIDYSDIPPLTPEMFANAIVRKGLKPLPPKRQVTLRIDDDVITYFRDLGRGYQTKINQLLRAYMDAHKSAR